jgi:hypothetical protein
MQLVRCEMTELGFSLHTLSEHLITQPTNPSSASVVGYLVEAGLINMRTAYANGTQVTHKGSMECRFVRIPTYAPDGQLLSASLKIDKMLLSFTGFTHSVARDRLAKAPQEAPKEPASRLKGKSNAVVLPELLTGPYGIPDAVLDTLEVSCRANLKTWLTSRFSWPKAWAL